MTEPISTKKVRNLRTSCEAEREGFVTPLNEFDNQCLTDEITVYAPNYAPLSCYSLIANLMI